MKGRTAEKDRIQVLDTLNRSNDAWKALKLAQHLKLPYRRVWYALTLLEQQKLVACSPGGCYWRVTNQ